jgi:hypothetical protein
MSDTNRRHPREVELARFGAGEPGADVAEHLRWCARCRSVVADYRWLQEEVEATLVEVAGAVDVPRSKWWAVQAQVCGDRFNGVLNGRASAVVSVVAACCMMLCVSPALRPSVAAHTAPPAPVTAPLPVAALVSDVSNASGEANRPGGPPSVDTADIGSRPSWPHLSGASVVVTPTPEIPRERVPLVRTPAPMLPPTPLEPGA